MKVALFILASLLVVAVIQASPLPEPNPEMVLAELESVGASIAQVMCGPADGEEGDTAASNKKGGRKGKGKRGSKGGKGGKGKKKETTDAPSDSGDSE